MESNTIWSFPDRGNWATHDGKYRGNWSPYIVRNLLLRYSFYEDLAEVQKDLLKFQDKRVCWWWNNISRSQIVKS